MISAIPVGGRGVTYGVKVLQRKAMEYRDQLVGVMEVEKQKESGQAFEFTFILVFREKNTLGHFVAFVNEWGTTSGTGTGSTGKRGYEEFWDFLHTFDEESVNICRVVWEEVNERCKVTLEQSRSQYERMKAWEQVVMDEFFPTEVI